MNQLIMPSAIGIGSVIFLGLYTANNVTNRLDKIEHKFLHNTLRQEDNMHHIQSIIREKNGLSGIHILEAELEAEAESDNTD